MTDQEQSKVGQQLIDAIRRVAESSRGEDVLELSRHACQELLRLLAAPTSECPISLNAEQEKTVQLWAADKRLFTTRETAEFNLRTFARKILRGRGEAR